jgi:hypothetical protein
MLYIPRYWCLRRLHHGCCAWGFCQSRTILCVSCFVTIDPPFRELMCTETSTPVPLSLLWWHLSTPPRVLETLDSPSLQWESCPHGTWIYNYVCSQCLLLKSTIGSSHCYDAKGIVSFLRISLHWALYIYQKWGYGTLNRMTIPDYITISKPGIHIHIRFNW